MSNFDDIASNRSKQTSGEMNNSNSGGVSCFAQQHSPTERTERSGSIGRGSNYLPRETSQLEVLEEENEEQNPETPFERNRSRVHSFGKASSFVTLQSVDSFVKHEQELIQNLEEDENENGERRGTVNSNKRFSEDQD